MVRKVVCKTCNGSGEIAIEVECASCNGWGKVEVEERLLCTAAITPAPKRSDIQICTRDRGHDGPHRTLQYIWTDRNENADQFIARRCKMVLARASNNLQCVLPANHGLSGSKEHKYQESDLVSTLCNEPSPWKRPRRWHPGWVG